MSLNIQLPQTAEWGIRRIKALIDLQDDTLTAGTLTVVNEIMVQCGTTIKLINKDADDAVWEACEKLRDTSTELFTHMARTKQANTAGVQYEKFLEACKVFKEAC